jgi:hypothetical protein
MDRRRPLPVVVVEDHPFRCLHAHKAPKRTGESRPRISARNLAAKGKNRLLVVTLGTLGCRNYDLHDRRLVPGDDRGRELQLA